MACELSYLVEKNCTGFGKSVVGCNKSHAALACFVLRIWSSPVLLLGHK